MFIVEIFHPPISTIHENDRDVIGNDPQIPQLNIVEERVNYKFIKIERRNFILDSQRDTPMGYNNLL